jgi:SPP1 family predicted phage head-tail adaptor
VIGTLRHRLKLQQQQRIPDSGGGADIVWSDIASVWAAIRAVSGGERDVSDRQDARTRYKIRLRFRADVFPGMRFASGSRFYNVQAVLDEDGRRKWLLCICEEGAQL